MCALLWLYPDSCKLSKKIINKRFYDENLHLERKLIYRESQQGKKANPKTKSIDAAKARDEVQPGHL